MQLNPRVADLLATEADHAPLVTPLECVFQMD